MPAGGRRAGRRCRRKRAAWADCGLRRSDDDRPPGRSDRPATGRIGPQDHPRPIRLIYGIRRPRGRDRNSFMEILSGQGMPVSFSGFILSYPLYGAGGSSALPEQESSMIAEATEFAIRNLPAALFIAALVLAATLRDREAAAERFLSWVLLLPIGVTGLWAALFHLFFPALAAAHIGWQTSPFQFEVGVADLAIGVTACLAFRRDLGFKAAAVIVASVFLRGAAGEALARPPSRIKRKPPPAPAGLDAAGAGGRALSAPAQTRRRRHDMLAASTAMAAPGRRQPAGFVAVGEETAWDGWTGRRPW